MTTRSPNPNMTTSHRYASQGPTAETMGAVTNQPTHPPADRIAADPSLGLGAPWDRPQIPAADASSTPHPMASRPVTDP